MSIASELDKIVAEIPRLQTAKADMKAAIEEKGITVGDGTIDTYAELIGQITESGNTSNNSEMQTGSFQVAEDTTETQYISWSLSKTPNYFVIYAENNEETAYTFIALFYGDFFNSFTTSDKQYIIHHGTSATTFGGGVRNFVQGGIESIDKNGVSFRGYTTSYYFRSSINYKWIAWTDEANTESLYNQGYEDGKNSVASFDRFLKTATFTSLNMFGTSEAVLNLDNITTLTRLFNVTYKSEEDLAYKNNTVEFLTINCKNSVTSMQDAFYAGRTVADTKLKHLTLNFVKSGIINYNNAFNGLDMLETIDGEPFDFSSVTTTVIGSIFSFCYALIDFRVVANTIYKSFSVQHSANLSIETIQSIIDGLADLTGSTSQTLTVHQTIRNKLTEEQLTTISNKNWAISPAEATQ